MRYTWEKTSIDRFERVPEWVNSTSISNIVGNAGLVYEATDTLSFRAQFSQGFRTPDLGSKFIGSGSAQDPYLLPNMELGPEKSNNYEFGVRYNNNDLFVDASVFYNIVDDYIKSEVLGYVNNHLLSRMINSDEYKVKGFELAASLRLGETGFTPYGNLTIIDPEINFGDHTTKNTGSPRSWGTIGLRWDHDFDENTHIFADVVYRNSGSFIEEPNSGFIMYRNKSGDTMDINLGWQFGDRLRWKTLLSVKNLFDKEYQPAYYGYPARHVALSASLIF
jgi:outer membrane receptor protein involved in Fe transport